MGKNKKNIPDGWLDYFPIRSEICGVRIIPFKCPLPSHRFEMETRKEFKWSPEDVLQRVPNLGLVIDLTYKFPPYYNPDEFLDAGVAYKKIGIVGHLVPEDEQFYEFCDVVQTFMMHNARNNRVIGVHCTHGVNRTGYMICRFMVEKLRYHPEVAFAEFAASRGYPVERENYRAAVYERCRPVY